MSKNQKTAVAALLAVALIALVPLFARQGAECGGELPGEVESLFFCLQTGLGVGVIAYGFGYLTARKKYAQKEQ